MLERKTDSLRYAFKGIAIAFRQELNFKIQLVLGLLAYLLGAYLHISQTEWLILVLVSAAVLSAEVFNTALEELCDMLRETHDPHVEKIKDLSAGAVLTVSLAALIAGVIIFLPKLLAL